MMCEIGQELFCPEFLKVFFKRPVNLQDVYVTLLIRKL